MGEDKKNSWYKNNSSKKMIIRSKDGLSKSHLFYFYLTYVKFSIPKTLKLLFYHYYSI